MGALQITPELHAVRISFQIQLAPDLSLPRFVYAWLLLGDRVLLIDSGVAGAEVPILATLCAMGRAPADVAAILLTHSHPDHIGAAKPLQATCACRVLAHPAERAWVEDVALQASQRPVPGFSALVAGPVRVDAPLQDGGVLDGPFRGPLRILHTPGHSPGSVSLFLENAGVLISGDAVPQPGSLPIYTDVAASARTLRRLLRLRGVQVLCSSWDEPRRNDAVALSLRAGLRALQSAHAAVRRALGRRSALEPLELCRIVVGDLGLPPFAANPLVAASMAAHRRILDDPGIDALLDPEV